MTARRLPLMIAMFLMPVVAAAAPLTPEDEAKHIGGNQHRLRGCRIGVLRGSIKSAADLPDPFGQPYPHAIFTAVIFGDRPGKVWRARAAGG